MQRLRGIRGIAAAAAVVVTTVFLAVVLIGDDDGDGRDGSSAAAQGAIGSGSPAPETPGDTPPPRPPGPSPEPLPPPSDPGYQPEALGTPSAGRSPLESPLKPTQTCEHIPVTLPNGERGTELGPPIPTIDARQLGNRVRVTYRFLAAPRKCAPEAIEAQVTPLNAPRYAPATKRARLRGLEGILELPAPEPGPPYGASLLTYSRKGAGSVTETRVR